MIVGKMYFFERANKSSYQVKVPEATLQGFRCQAVLSYTTLHKGYPIAIYTFFISSIHSHY